MFEITAGGHFDAAHFLRGYEGKCAHIHGHRWKIEVAVRGRELNEMGILIDFVDVKNVLREITAYFDHKLINDMAPFDTINPTAENLARYIYQQMAARLEENTREKGDKPPAWAGKIRVTRVTVWESEGAAASYWEEGDN